MLMQSVLRDANVDAIASVIRA